jgi:penicillin-binding protein 1C
MRDNWCVGYSPKFTVGVWVGNFSGDPMWNVSGISGAAPVWVELMNWLHRNAPHRAMEPPPGLVRASAPSGIVHLKEEWFLRGTEPLPAERKGGPYQQRIVYPPSGAILAWDPDIPAELQKIFFISQDAPKGVKWVLNGETLPGNGKAIPWSSKVGRYQLALVDGQGRVVDSVRFEIRGPAEAGEKEGSSFRAE